MCESLVSFVLIAGNIVQQALVWAI